MKQKTHVRSIKLKLFIKNDDPETKKQQYNRFNQISNDCWQAANWVMSGHYMNDMLMRRIYDRRKIDIKNMDEINEIEAEFFSKTGFFKTKREAAGERDIKAKFPEIPPCVSNELKRNIFKIYKTHKTEIMMGNKMIPNFKNTMPFPVRVASTHFYNDENEFYMKWNIAKGEAPIHFGIGFGKDPSNHKLTLKRIIDGELKFGVPNIQRKNKKIYLLLPVHDIVKGIEFKPDVSVGVDLGVAIPAYAAVNNGSQKMAIGNIDDFLKTRLQMQARYRRLQKSAEKTHGQHGRERKLKALNKLQKKERLFVFNYNHFISRKIVDFAAKNCAGIIKLEFLKGFGKEEKNKFILRNWSFFELQTMITYKAKQFGMEVKTVDPYHTSKTCSACGHVDNGNRESQSNFVCKKCGLKINADYNAAINIANSTKYVTKIEKTEYHKKQKLAA